MKILGNRLLSKPQGNPAELAKVFYRALTVSKPKKYYSANVSNLFKLLSIMPSGMREFFMIRQLRNWM